MALRVGADIGGTFTDIVLSDANMGTYSEKVLTTYGDYSEGVMNGIERALRASDLNISTVDTMVHGTTLVANALIERKGAKAALLCTEGFRDVLEIGTENRYDLEDLHLEKPAPLVPRHLRLPVRERIGDRGDVVTPLDESSVTAAVEHLREEGVEAVAVVFLHSYKNPVHEQRVAQFLRDRLPGVRVALSSEVVPTIREYPRTTTTLANVYVQPIVEGYLRRLENRLYDTGFDGRLLLMLSGGGTVTVDTACRFPIRLLESGPIGGIMAAIRLGEDINGGDLLAVDMGGTTAKACVVRRGRPDASDEFEVNRIWRFKKGSGLPMKVPVIDMIEIGAGGGSVADVSKFGLLKVGPHSAASEPGPACYGRGGRRPTVTDADLILGYLDPNFFLGGQMMLDAEAARRSVESEVAEPLGLDLLEAAWGIHQIVNENMANAARAHLVEKGEHPPNYALFASGGAGPVHACHVAEILGIGTVVVPAEAGTASAFGLLCAPVAFEQIRTLHGRIGDLPWSELGEMLEDMEWEGRRHLDAAGVEPEQIGLERSCEMRYVGQANEITVALPEEDELDEGVLREHFERGYKSLYKRVNADLPVETLTWHVKLSAPAPEVSIQDGTGRDTRAGLKGYREAYMKASGGLRTVPIYDRYALVSGASVPGPAVVEERGSTVVLPEGCRAQVDDVGNLVVRMEGTL